MLATDFIRRVRLVLDDKQNVDENPVPTYTDAEILDHGQEQARSLIRIQVQRGKGFHNFSMALPNATTASVQVRQVATSVWQYSLPDWIVQVAGVWELASNPPANYSVHTYSSNELPQVGAELPRYQRNSNRGFMFDGQRTLRVYGYAAAPALYLEVAKLPPAWFKVTIDKAHANASRFYLPVTDYTLGLEDPAEGAYINAYVRVVSSSVADQFGSERRVVYSNAAVMDGSTRRHEIYLEAPFGIATALPVGSVVESSVPIKNEHARLLVLAAADACLTQRGNLAGARALAPEYARQMQAFETFAAELDTIKGPHFYQDDVVSSSPSEPDRATHWSQ